VKFPVSVIAQSSSIVQVEGDIDSHIASVSKNLSDLELEEEEEGVGYYSKDLPPHACKYCGIHDPGNKFDIDKRKMTF